MSQHSRSYRQTLQRQAESVSAFPPGRRGSDTLLQDTTLLVLGPDRGAVSPYRRWAADHGGVGLHVEGEFGLIDWLERNTFVRSMVVIDDDRCEAQAAAAIAAEVRALRSDVPVILVIDPDDEEAIESDAGWPSFAVELRPMSLAGFHKAVEIARLMAAFDRDSQPRSVVPHLKGQAVLPVDSELLDDHMGPRSGWWIVPALAVGAILWALIFWLVLGLLLPAGQTVASN